MADDIDIEEHDILAHPRFRDFLPNPDIKEEPEEVVDDVDVEQYEDRDEHKYEDYDYYETPDYDPELEKRSYRDYGETSSGTYAVPVSPPQLSNDIYQQNNKIILGTKPCSKTGQIESIPANIATKSVNALGNINMFATNLCPKSRKPITGTVPMISKVQGSIAKLGPKFCRPEMASASKDSQGTFVFGTKPGPKSRKLTPTSSKMLLNPQGSITIGTKPNPKSAEMITDTETATKSRFPIVFGSKPSLNPADVEMESVDLVPSPLQFKPCPKSRKLESQSSILKGILSDSHDPIVPTFCQKPERVPEDAVVVLEDWSVRLETSQCYCDQCQTLFATRNALDAHNMIAHSFLVALEDPATPEVQSPEAPLNQMQNYCNQCQTYFADGNLLIQHLYEHLTAKKGRLFYKCPICFSFFKSNRRFYKHSVMYHGVSLSGNVKKVPYKNECEVCKKQLSCIRSCNKHIGAAHRNLFAKKVKIQKANLNKIVKRSVAPTVFPKLVNKTVQAKVSAQPDHSGNVVAKSGDEETGSVSSETNKMAEETKLIFKCGKCKTVYSTRNSVQKHINRHHPGETSFLQIYEGHVNTFRNGNILQTNEGSVPLTSKLNIGNFKCVKCKTFYSNTTTLKTHINQKHPNEKAFIDLRKSATQVKRTQNVSQYLTNMNPETDQGNLPLTSRYHKANFKCVKCKTLYTTRNSLKCHINRKHPKAKAFIDLRKNVGPSVSHVNDSKTDEGNIPLTSKHNIGNFKCVKCKTFYMHIKSLKCHINRKHPKEKAFINLSKSTPGNPKQFLSNTKPVNSDLKFKCGKCKTEYTSRKTVVTHIRQQHPNDRKYFEVNGNTARPVIAAGTFHRTVLPVNAMFKCFKCGLHMISANTAVWHIHQHKEESSTTIGCHKWTCKVCNRVIRSKDKFAHLEQHDRSKNIKVYTLSRNMYKRVLYKCENCDVYFLERHFLKHYSVGCEGSDSFWCSICNVSVADDNHSAVHSKSNKSDFIFLDKFFVSSGNDYKTALSKTKPEPNVSEDEEYAAVKPVSASLKRKQLPTHCDSAKKAKTSHKIQFYYCEYCHMFSKTPAYQNFHKSKECLTIKLAKTVCQYCGLLFRGGNPFNCHTMLHQNDKIKFADFEFFSMKDLKPTVPALPAFLTCDSCKMHHTHKNHTCEEAKKVCKKCDKVFDPLAYKLHQIHHKYLMPTEIDDVSELIQKYESLKSTWNIIYMCPECDLATDSYDRAVDHAQRHLTASANRRTARMCEICTINFDELSIKKHKELHTNEDINRASFSILTYRHKDLVTDDWFKLFKNLSQAEIDQITSPSIYVTRSVKMNLILNGPPEFTIYKCESCKNYVDSSNVFDHSQVCDGKGTPPHPCATCDIPFISSNALKKHQQIHKTSKVTTNSYRIVSFNAKADKEFNKKLINAEIAESPPLLDILNDEDNIPKAKTAVFLQCLKCKSCSTSAEFFRAHFCKPNNDKYLWSCRKCPYISAHRNKDAHLKWHEDNSDLKRKDMLMIPFDRTRDPVQTDSPYKVPPNKTYLWFQCCQCKVLLNSSNARHACSTDLETCSLCGYKFLASFFKFHIKLHERMPNLTRDKIHIVPFKGPEKINKIIKKVINEEVEDDDSERVATVYKCRCGLHFTSEKTIQKHSETCSPDVDISSENCSKCGLLFPTELLVSHLCNQHRRGSTGMCRIVTPPTNLYRCSECLCVFRNMTEFTDHHTSNTCDTGLAVKCDKCGMTFHQRRIDEHRASHREFEKLQHKIVTMGKYNRETLYRCNLCTVHYLDENVFRQHLAICKNTTNKSYCKSCGLLFAVQSISKHCRMHHSTLVLTADDFNIVCEDPYKEEFVRVEPQEVEIEFDSKTKLFNYSCMKTNFNTTLYKCWCGVCFSIKNKFLQHLNSDHSANKEWCPECGYIFTPEGMKEHIKVHHEIMHLETEDFFVATKDDGVFVLKRKHRDVNGKPKPSNCFYVCEVCCLSFTDMESAVTHINNCQIDNSVQGETCDICGLNFKPSGLINHKNMYHDGFKYTLNDLHIYIVTKHSESESIHEYTDLDERVNESLDNLNVSNLESEEPTKLNKISLYKCKKCELHFLSVSSVFTHTPCGNQGSKACENCGLLFSYKTCTLHQREHHSEENNYTIDDFHIQVQEGLSAFENMMTGNVIYKCTDCDVNFLCFRSLWAHYDRGHNFEKDVVPCPDCGVKFTPHSLRKHQAEYHKRRSMQLKDFVFRNIDNQIINANDQAIQEESSAKDIPVTPVATDTSNSCDILNDTAVQSDESDVIAPALDTTQTDTNIGDDVSMNQTVSQIDADVLDTSLKDTALSQSSDGSKNKTPKTYKTGSTRLYKCGACNVFFLNQNTCYRHIMYHTSLDTKEYIECKLCSLQFKIMSLALHIRRHHNSEFDLSNVLVEEYKPKKDGEKTPKIEIYYAIDKVQSRLVSTTTDDDKSTQEVTQSHVEEPTETVTSETTDGQIEEDDKSISGEEKDGNTSSLNEQSNDRISETVIPSTSVLLDEEGTIINSLPERDGAFKLNFEDLALENTTTVPDTLNKDRISSNVETVKDIFTSIQNALVEVDKQTVSVTDKDRKSKNIVPEKDSNTSTSIQEDAIEVDSRTVFETDKDISSNDKIPEKDSNKTSHENPIEVKRPTVSETDEDSGANNKASEKDCNKSTSSHEDPIEVNRPTVSETDSKSNNIVKDSNTSTISHEDTVDKNVVTIPETLDEGTLSNIKLEIERNISGPKKDSKEVTTEDNIVENIQGNGELATGV